MFAFLEEQLKGRWGYFGPGFEVKVHHGRGGREVTGALEVRINNVCLHLGRSGSREKELLIYC